jgi:hypothetical protein
MHSESLLAHGAHFGRLLSHWSGQKVHMQGGCGATDLDLLGVAGMAGRQSWEARITGGHYCDSEAGQGEIPGGSGDDEAGEILECVGLCPALI